MIRFGLLFSDSARWLGGRNYLQNLLSAVMALTDRKIEPVLFVAPGLLAADLIGFEGIEIVRSAAVDNKRSARWQRLASMAVLSRDPALERLLRRHRIDVLSHSRTLGARAAIPAITWIADFQHVRMPHFFMPAEIRARDRGFRRNIAAAKAVVLSSADAQRDLARFAPGADAKSHVLNFVAGLVQSGDMRAREYLRATYGIDEPFFFLPNQFWKHKNHRVVIDALALLNAEGKAPLVICTGKGEDGRNPDHFGSLMQHAADVGVAQRFCWLGLVPYPDLSVLMREAVAVINPSHFEGWSTTVEEAKSVGKTILLSDIPVHREQAPARCTYFPADDAKALATILTDTLSSHDPQAELVARTAALLALPQRRRAFAEAYQRIVLQVV